MPEDNYFTPSIEDIRVGYECEAGHYTYEYPNGLSVAKENWEKIVLEEGSIGKYIGLKRILDGVTNHQGIWLRVPYLTKEQIEAEGWKVQPRHNEYFPLPFKKKGYVALHYPESHSIEIQGSSEDLVLFSGKCPDINTFRYICKLLGI